MLNYNILNKILSKTNTKTIRNISLLSSNYSKWKNYTVCCTCKCITKKKKGMFYYPLLKQYFNISEINKTFNVNVNYIIFYCYSCFINIDMDKCALCKCFSKFISSYLSLSRSIIYYHTDYGIKTEHNLLFYPQKNIHDYLKGNDRLCNNCIQHLINDGFTKIIKYSSNLCSICHLYTSINNILEKDIICCRGNVYKIMTNNNLMIFD